jgi:hypothetical protein
MHKRIHYMAMYCHNNMIQPHRLWAHIGSSMLYAICTANIIGAESDITS